MRAPVHASASDCPLPKARRHVGHGHLLAPTRMGVNRNADQPPCLSCGGPRVRISLPPAVSLRTFGPSFRKPLACSGPDAVWNLQWQPIADAKAKDAWE